MVKLMHSYNVELVTNNKLCSGCGACTVICRNNCISIKYGINYNYPYIDNTLCSKCGLCLKICPGKSIMDRISKANTIKMQDALINYVAYSNDENIRYNAASGGVISSINIFLLQHKYVDGVICVKQGSNKPLTNESYIAVSSSEVLQSLGSRYSPVSNCRILKEILYDNKHYAFVGKPCEIDAINQMQNYIPELSEKIKLKISIMCAGTPSRKGTLKLLKSLNVDPIKVSELSYRGDGWPGFFKVKTEDGSQSRIPYLYSWNNCLSKYSCLRCIVCDDPLGNGADITVGDAWDQNLLSSNNGFSAVIIRTETGRQYMNMAVENNVLTAEEVSPEDICRFQKGLLRKTEKAVSNIFAYNFVFLRKLNFKSLHNQFGNNVKSYYSILKKLIKFIIYKFSAIYD